jgi:twitching motility two-component system response regulator PilH
MHMTGLDACSLLGEMTKSHSILVVDDEPNVRDLFVDVLEEAGHRVEVAHDGAQALDRLRDGSAPCVVLADVRMPRMDGFELSRAAARDPQLAAIPIVTMTGDRVLSFSSPARDKPFSVAELDALVQRSCQLHREHSS